MPPAPRAVAAVSGYQVPSQPLVDLLAQPVPPHYAFSRDRSALLRLTRPPPHPPITDFMREELKLAGMRIDADLSARTRMGCTLGVDVMDWAARPAAAFVSDLPAAPLTGVPEGMVLNYVRWNTSGSRFSFTLRSDGKPGSPAREPLSLHVAAPGDMAARPVPGCGGLNVIFEDYAWLGPDALVAAAVPGGRGPRPPPPAAPAGPKISDNSSGRTSKARTYPDLLQSEHDGALFEWLTTSELVYADVATGEHRVIGPPRMYTGIDPSPDGRYLLVSWIERPFSYELPVGRFPRVWQVWDRRAPRLSSALLPLTGRAATRHAWGRSAHPIGLTGAAGGCGMRSVLAAAATRNPRDSVICARVCRQGGLAHAHPAKV